MITKNELRTRLFHMVSIALVAALITMCGFIVVPQLTIPETDPLMTMLKFLTTMAFIVHIFGMMCIGTLLVGDTLKRVMHGNKDDCE